jgi:hypothetical protein
MLRAPFKDRTAKEDAVGETVAGGGKGVARRRSRSAIASLAVVLITSVLLVRLQA